MSSSEDEYAGFVSEAQESFSELSKREKYGFWTSNSNSLFLYASVASMKKGMKWKLPLCLVSCCILVCAVVTVLVLSGLLAGIVVQFQDLLFHNPSDPTGTNTTVILGTPPYCLEKPDNTYYNCFENGKHPISAIPAGTISEATTIVKEMNVSSSLNIPDNTPGSVGSGLSGIAIMLLREASRSSKQEDQRLEFARTLADRSVISCQETKACSFNKGRAGQYAVSAAVYSALLDRDPTYHVYTQHIEKLRRTFSQLTETCTGAELPVGLHEGLASYLQTSSWMRKWIPDQIVKEIIPESTHEGLIDTILNRGKTKNATCPYVWNEYGRIYLDFGSGLAGIVPLLLNQKTVQTRENTVRDLAQTVVCHLKHQKGDGSIPAFVGSKDLDTTLLRGTTGWMVMLAEVLQSTSLDTSAKEAIKESLRKASDYTWNSGLSNNIGFAEGLTSSVYAFFRAYNATGEPEYLARGVDIFSFISAHRSQLQGSQIPSLNYGFLSLLSIAQDIAFWGAHTPSHATMPNYAVAGEK